MRSVLIAGGVNVTKKIKEYNITNKKLNELLQAMEYVKHDELYFAVEIKVIGCDKPEIIINPHENLESKIRYYSKAYDDDCKLKANPNIEIVNYAYTYGNAFNELQENLIKNKA